MWARNSRPRACSDLLFDSQGGFGANTYIIPVDFATPAGRVVACAFFMRCARPAAANRARPTR